MIRDRSQVRVILVTGDRNWTSERAVRAVIEKILTKWHRSKILFVCGGAKGLDSLFHSVAQGEFGIPCAVFTAPWTYYGRPAGPIRNTWMLDWTDPDTVVAFHKNIKESKGTKDMAKKSLARGKKVIPVGFKLEDLH